MNEEKVIVMEQNEDGIFVPSHVEKEDKSVKLKSKKRYRQMQVNNARQQSRRSPVEEVMDGFSIGLEYIEEFKKILRRF